MNEQKTVKKFTINRQSWIRGTGDGKLHTKNHRQCCLGFLCRAAGFSVKDITEKTLPGDVESLDLETLFPAVSQHVFASVNDAALSDSAWISGKLVPIVSEEQREQILIRLFKDNNIKVTFIN